MAYQQALLVASVLLAMFSGRHVGANEWDDRRLAVITVNEESTLVLATQSGTIQKSLVTKSQKFQGWENVELPPGVNAVSNPCTQSIGANLTMIAVQVDNGQVYGNLISLDGQNFNIGNWYKVGGSQLSIDKDATLHGKDSVIIKIHEKQIKVFARSMTNASRLYLSSYGKDEKWTDWTLLGGNKHALQTDVAVAYNSFTTLLEAFMISTDGYLYRSWQVKGTKWATWDKTGYFAPKSTHAPVAHSMDTNMFNGRLNVFVQGTDNEIHHIWQTTCDGVPNPWGWCTWSSWYSIGGEMPETRDVANTLSSANNIHLGIELFTTSKDGKLWKMYQTAKHQTWQNWELVKGMSDYHAASLPTVINDATGWLAAYVIDDNDEVVVVTEPKPKPTKATKRASDF